MDGQLVVYRGYPGQVGRSESLEMAALLPGTPQHDNGKVRRPVAQHAQQVDYVCRQGAVFQAAISCKL
jgi:hypothetical protein